MTLKKIKKKTKLLFLASDLKMCMGSVCVSAVFFFLLTWALNFQGIAIKSIVCVCRSPGVCVRDLKGCQRWNLKCMQGERRRDIRCHLYQLINVFRKRSVRNGWHGYFLCSLFLLVFFLCSSLPRQSGCRAWEPKTLYMYGRINDRDVVRWFSFRFYGNAKPALIF